jgi:hypothetical protein
MEFMLPAVINKAPRVRSYFNFLAQRLSDSPGGTYGVMSCVTIALSCVLQDFHPAAASSALRLGV